MAEHVPLLQTRVLRAPSSTWQVELEQATEESGPVVTVQVELLQSTAAAAASVPVQVALEQLSDPPSPATTLQTELLLQEMSQSSPHSWLQLPELLHER